MKSTPINKNDLDELGLIRDMDEPTADALVGHVNDTLQERIGTEITSYLEDDEVEQLMEMQQQNTSDAELADWLEKRIPNLDDIASQERAILLGELVENAASLA